MGKTLKKLKNETRDISESLREAQEESSEATNQLTELLPILYKKF